MSRSLCPSSAVVIRSRLPTHFECIPEQMLCIFQTHAQSILRIATMFVSESRPVCRNQPRPVPLAHIVGLLRPLRKLMMHARLQSFFATISRRMC